MHHRPKTLLVHSDVVHSTCHFVVVEGWTWEEALREADLSFMDVVVDYENSSLVKGYTPLITRLCRELALCVLFAEKADECMEELLDEFRFFKALMKGLRGTGNRVQH